MRRFGRQVQELEKVLKQKIEEKNAPNPLIIFEAVENETAEEYNARLNGIAAEFRKKYPDYKGALIMLPKKEELPDEDIE